MADPSTPPEEQAPRRRPDPLGRRLPLQRDPLTGRQRHGRYAVIVGVEYLTCILMLLASAGLTAGESSGDELAEPVLFPLRLTAVSALFFVLALLTAGPRTGRLAAGFGGLITTAVALNATSLFTSLADIFTGGQASAKTAAKAAKKAGS